MPGGPAASWRPLKRQRCPPVGDRSRARRQPPERPRSVSGGGGAWWRGGPGTCAPAAPPRPAAGPGSPAPGSVPRQQRWRGRPRVEAGELLRSHETRRGRCLSAGIPAGCGVETAPAESYRSPLCHGQPGRAEGCIPQAAARPGGARGGLPAAPVPWPELRTKVWPGASLTSSRFPE